MDKMYLLGEVARILNRKPHQVGYLLATGVIPEPDQRIANKRLFTEQDVVRLARHFKVAPDWSAVGRDDGSNEPVPPKTLTLVPPFDVLQVNETGHEVRDGDGVVFCWASDRSKALIIAGVLESAVRG